MYKLKEWLLWYFLVGAYIWGWCSVAACVFVPFILGACISPWWLLSWIVTIPAAITTVILIRTGGSDEE